MTTTSYSGNTVVSTDQALHSWTHYTDSLGRLTAVLEPRPDGSSGSLETDYVYDALNNLKTVKQLGISGTDVPRITRKFNYDSLNRLTSSMNGETGQINYYYQTAGSLCAADVNSICSRIDARGITTTYSYDILSRLTKESYSDGVTHNALFGYDGKMPDGTAAYGSQYAI